MGWLTAAAVLCAASTPSAQVRLQSESDRAAFRAWFVWLVDAQFYHPTPDVTDCAALVRHAYGEALTPHTPEWMRRRGILPAPAFPEIDAKPTLHPTAGPSRDTRHRPLFRTAGGALVEFADAQTLIRYNATFIARDAAGARPGDLLYFVQPSQQSPHHLMVYVGRSAFEPEGADWVVYHTGPDGTGPGEVRKTSLAVLRRHPEPRWRPISGNPQFAGIFRLRILAEAGR